MSMIKRGDVFMADLNPVVGCEQGGYRPVLVIQNNVGNKFSPTIIVAAMSSRKEFRSQMPTHVSVGRQNGEFNENTTVFLEQIRTLDVRRFRRQLGALNEQNMRRVDEALRISVGLNV